MAKFQPGQSGNPKGRPKKGQTLSDILRKELAVKGEDGITRQEVIMRKLIGMAEEGHMGAIREIYNRIEGKIPDVVHTAELPKIVIVDETAETATDD